MRMLRRMKKSCQLLRELRPMSMSSKNSPESRNATAACPSGICGAIHSTLSPEQCGCKGCQRHLESPGSEVDINSIELELPAHTATLYF
jgi:hypothetical protein